MQNMNRYSFVADLLSEMFSEPPQSQPEHQPRNEQIEQPTRPPAPAVAHEQMPSTIVQNQQQVQLRTPAQQAGLPGAFAPSSCSERLANPLVARQVFDGEEAFDPHNVTFRVYGLGEEAPPGLEVVDNGNRIYVDVPGTLAPPPTQPPIVPSTKRRQSATAKRSTKKARLDLSPIHPTNISNNNNNNMPTHITKLRPILPRTTQIQQPQHAQQIPHHAPQRPGQPPKPVVFPKRVKIVWTNAHL